MITQIEPRRFNKQRVFLGAFVFKFEQSAVVIKMPFYFFHIFTFPLI